MAVLDAKRALRQVQPDSVESGLLAEIDRRKASLQSEMSTFARLCDRWDALYYPETVLENGGASHWAEHPSATTPGQAHISVNVPPVYVDIPASLQSVPPIENVISGGLTEQDRLMASFVERVYSAWKSSEEWDLKFHEACVVKGLYGRTAAKVFWDEDEGRPCVSIIDQPRNLYLGWGRSDHTKMNWALYMYRLSAESVEEEFGLQVDLSESDNITPIPIVRDSITEPVPTRVAQRNNTELQVEVYDYWYRKPVAGRREPGKAVKFETWNAIFVGNYMVKNEVHAEYKGKMPYVPLFNTYIPGVADGRPELYDVEQLIREKDERMTGGAQMFNKALHQPWQLTGAEAPDVVPQGLKPVPDKVSAPGAGNRIEPITPWLPEFQLEQFIARIDRDMADVTGLNDLLRGLAPASVLSSSKAIATLVANYEARIRMKRDLAYAFRRNVWKLCETIWTAKDEMMAEVLATPYVIDIQPPSLTPRDDMEVAARTGNLLDRKIWSQSRAMDANGVDDPETEQQIIRQERTDATMFPADVQMMVQLMLILQQMGLAQPPGLAGQAGQTQDQMLADQRTALGGQQGSPMMNAPEEQAQMPPEGLPANAEGAITGGPVLAQNQLKGGEVSNRILSQQTIEPGG